MTVVHNVQFEYSYARTFGGSQDLTWCKFIAKSILASKYQVSQVSIIQNKICTAHHRHSDLKFWKWATTGLKGIPTAPVAKIWRNREEIFWIIKVLGQQTPIHCLRFRRAGPHQYGHNLHRSPAQISRQEIMTSKDRLKCHSFTSARLSAMTLEKCIWNFWLPALEGIVPLEDFGKVW